MDKINEFRVENLKRLIRDHRTQSDFANKITKSQSQVAQWVNGHKPIGEKIARDIEEKLALPTNFLDKDHNNSTGDSEYYDVPVYPFRLSAGGGCEVTDERPIKYYPIPVDEVTRKGWKKERLFVVAVSGDSMEPTILSGQEVLVHREERQIIDNKFYAICMNDEVFIKRLFKNPMQKKVLIKSDNPNWPDIEVSEPEINIIGRVVLLLAREV